MKNWNYYDLTHFALMIITRSLDIVCIIKESAILCPIQHLAHLLPVVHQVREGPSVDLHVLAGQLRHRNPQEFLHPGQCLHRA